MISKMLGLLLIAFAGSVVAADPSRIMVSKSALRTDSVPINEVTCLTRDNFIYLDQADDGTVDMVVWYTQSGRSPLKYNVKKQLDWPYNFKGGTDVNALSWSTELVRDGAYSIHASSFLNRRNVAVDEADFIVCNRYMFLVSQNDAVTDAQVLSLDTVIDDTLPIYLVVSPIDNVVGMTVTLDGEPLENTKDGDGNYYFKTDVSDYKDWFMTTDKPHVLRAEIQLITGATSILSYTFPAGSVEPSAAPSAAPSTAPTGAPTAVLATEPVATGEPTKP